MKKDPLLDVLRKASKGLRYTSETEAGFKPFVWPNDGELTPVRLRGHAGAVQSAVRAQPLLRGSIRHLFHADDNVQWNLRC